MKKNIFLYSALALGMTGMFASCSSDDVVEVSGGNTGTDATAQVIEIAVDNANSLSTRSGRPLYSEEPDQTIEHVAVVITSADGETKDDIVYATVIDNWTGEDAVSSEYGDHSYNSTVANGRSYKLTIPKEKKLPAGDYNIYAVGYSTNSEYTIKSKAIGTYFEGLETEPTGNFEPNVVVANNTGKTEGEEIFAGSTTAEVNSDLVFTSTVNLYLHRQVAGIYTYVMEIPYVKVDGGNVANYLRVVASDNNDNLVLGHFWTGEQDANELPGNGNNTGENANYVVNGYRTAPSATSTVLYTIDLKKWFRVLKDDDNDGAIDAGENWIKTAEKEIYKEKGLSFTVGSAFGGGFLIPFLANGSNQTLKLELVYAGSETEAKTAGQESVGASWNIKLPEAYNHAICAWETTQWNEVASETSTTAYSILRNHLYGVGERPKNDPGNGGGDPDPDPENPDKPQPLKNTQDVILKVNDNWEVIHHMVIE